MTKNQKRLTTLAMLMAAAPLYAGNVNEIERNDTLQSAQYIMINDKVMDSNGAIGTVGSSVKTQDIDFYTFYAKSGDVVTLDIDYGYGGVQKIDTIVAVFDSMGKMLRMNDDATSVDTGSSSRLDARIDNFVIATSGTYTVGVSTYPRYFSNGGAYTVRDVNNGDYHLLISGVSPSVQQISIEIKPGSGALAPMNPKSKGKVPVALLSDSKFNALDADPATITFGASGSEDSLSKCNSSGEDVNGDGLLDLVCHFENQTAGFEYGDLEGIVRGETRGGLSFEGRGLLKIVPVLTK